MRADKNNNVNVERTIRDSYTEVDSDTYSSQQAKCLCTAAQAFQKQCKIRGKKKKYFKIKNKKTRKEFSSNLVFKFK